MLQDKLNELISACFTRIWIETHEHHEAIAEVQQLGQEQGWQVATWDIDRGLSTGSGDSLLEATDPLAAIRAVNAMATPEGTAILIMNNLHKFISSTEILQALQHQLLLGKQNRTIVIGLSPATKIPTELEKLFAVVEHALLRRQQLEEIVRIIATGEDVWAISQRGFSIADLQDVGFDPEPDQRPPQFIDWDELELERNMAVVSQGRIRHFA